MQIPKNARFKIRLTDSKRCQSFFLCNFNGEKKQKSFDTLKNREEDENVADWEAIKQEYLSTKISQRDLAQKYDVSPSTLAKKASSEGWTKLRKKYWSKVEAKTIEKLSRKKACDLARIGSAADKLVRLIDDSLNDSKSVRETYVTEYKGPMGTEKPIVEEIRLKKLDAKHMRNLAATLKDLTAVLRDVNDRPNKTEREQIKASKERLEIEKKRAAAGMPIDDEEYGIAYLPETIEPTEEGGVDE